MASLNTLTASISAERSTVARIPALPRLGGRQARGKNLRRRLSDRPAKRVFDLTVAAMLIVLLAPVMAAIALLVRLDSRGPVFFRQTRTGLRGRPFAIIKFRSMAVLEDGESIVQATKDDSRTTRLGRILRKTSLDELPQLFNVLRGEMSLVGPRPHAIAHDRHYGALIDNYAIRQRVKPGITGWAQVNGFRGATPTLALMQARIRHDVWYAQRAGLAFDLRILLATPFAILGQRNAY
ncbi:MAG TPA: exopolysaccharide biosynthesis polyprenyl glycosylphosphotransferase [Rhizomicrobium sp.]|nr:exopolysaccharide biosynthesis polyprenyl glycosylphosphotransferase [Rhizomicrobium sp.]